MDPHDLMSIAEAFYDGIFAPGGWTDGLGRLARLTSSDAASLILLNRDTSSAMIGEQVGLPEPLLIDYQAHYHLQDPGLPFADTIQVGDWYMDERDLGLAKIRQSAFYQDFLKPYALDSTMATSVIRAQGADGFLSLSACPARRDMPRIASALKPLLPHLERAVRLRMQFWDVRQQLELSTYVLDQLRFAVLILTFDKQVLLANQMGQQWLSRPENSLGAKSAHAEKMSVLLKTACGLNGVRRAVSMTLRKPDGNTLFLTAVPLPEAAIRSWQPGPPKALLWINDPGQAKPPAGALLQHIFGLTPAEVRLTRLLLQGLTLKEAMGQLNLSLETGRTQLKAVFFKLGIRRQTELHRLLGRLDVLEIAS